VGSLSLLAAIDLRLAFQFLDNLVQLVEACPPELTVLLDPCGLLLQPAQAEPAGPHAPDLLGRLEKAETFSQENYALFTAYLERHRKEIHPPDLALAAFLCVTGIEALTHTAVLHRKLLSDQAMQALQDEATRLVVGYLAG
jgi:hypothetical protein